MNVDKYLKKHKKISNKIKVLEVGSNDGYLLSRFKKNNYSVLGVDASKKCVKLLKKKNKDS